MMGKDGQAETVAMTPLLGAFLPPDIETSIIQWSGRLSFVRLSTASQTHLIGCNMICPILEAACYAGLVHMGLLKPKSHGEGSVHVQSKCEDDYKDILENFSFFTTAEAMKNPAGSIERLLGDFLFGERLYYKGRTWSLEYVGDLEGIVFGAEKFRPEVRVPVSKRMSSRTGIEQPHPWSLAAKDLRWNVPWPLRRTTL